MNTVELVRALAATSSRLDKEQLIMDAFIRGERDFFRGAVLAYDPLISFGVKKVAEILEDDGSTGNVDWKAFEKLATALRNRELTGHAARDAIHALAGDSTTSLWNEFYRRVLLKDLKCGVEDSTINKVLKKISQAYPEANDYIIPLFECQLAHDGVKPEHEKKVRGVKMLDVKLDGVRVLTVLDKPSGTVTQYMRNGKVTEAFPHITEALTKLLPLLPGSLILDGEVVGTSFSELMTQLNRKVGKNSANAKLALFDILPLEDFKKGICEVDQETRHSHLSSLSAALQEHTGSLVYVIPKVTVDLDTPEGYAAFIDYNKQAIAAGYEGIMVKDPRASYQLKRSVAWLKIKPFIEVSLEVIGTEEGKADGKRGGKVGALACRGEDDGKIIEVNVGGGLSDAQVEEWTADPSKIIGMIVEVRADAFSQGEDNKLRNTYSLRFPRLKGLRGTKPGEKL